MKKFLNKKIYFLLMFCSVAIFVISCNNDSIGTPVITDVRNYAASPKDTIMTDAVADQQWVVIEGQNLQNALKISFNGVPTTFKSTLLTPNSAIVQIPAIIFSTIDENKLYTLEYVTSEGSTTFSFHLGPAAPVITAISDVFAQPNDSVYIYGTDLVLLKSFSYGGTPINAVTTNLSGTVLGFLMPSPAPTSGDVVVTTMSGVATLKIVATPTITGISNENAIANDSVFVYGTYLKGIQSFTFSGSTITSFKSNSNGSAVGFKMPSISASGPASITTSFGTATTVYDVYNPYNVQYAGSATTGIVANMEWGDAFGWGWWGGSALSVSDPGATGGWISLHTDMAVNKGMFITITDPVLAVGASGGRIPIGAAQWMPVGNLNDAVDNWAIKFEINVPQSWKGSTIAIQTDFNSSYTARFEPWQITPTTSAAYSTKGWTTVTIPLSMFRAKDPTLGEGKGASITKLTEILGGTGKTGCAIFNINYGKSSTTTGIHIGFDNVRVVKIK
ncbi:MAG: glycan-binding surface protein [Flavobacterium sp.]|uniref:glycan-binding surface protein n=1 Tax=Flavobacterium sp. TaxID=239 RepID=UPI00261DD100|nr:glycan-binding surface protein [Flavobacterium sp.]MDD5149816.1 glycan-binding surface protein [Flavobacterium sp.]